RVAAITLIREPEDAVLEFVIAKGYLSVRQALRGYLRFYSALLPYRDQVVVGPFREVTSDYGEVIAKVNAMFGTRFLEFDHTDDNVRSAFAAIEADPRSGMTLAVVAFEMARTRQVQVACHVHAPAQVIEAARRRIPALVLVREPEPTILSFVIRHPYVSMRQALRGYVRFYAPL